MSAQPFGSMSRGSGPSAEDWRANPEEPTYARGPLRETSGGGGLFSVRTLLALAALAVAVKVGVALAPDFVRYMKIRNM